MNPSFLIFLYFISIGILAIFATWSKYYKEEWYPRTKPLPIILIIIIFTIHLIFTDKPLNTNDSMLNNYLLFPGLVFGFIGDLLLLDKRRFIFGLFSFLAGHFFYIGAFFVNQWNIPYWITILILIFSIGYGIIINKSLIQKKMNRMIIPSWIYNIIILLMFYFALNWEAVINKNNFPFIGLGALLFCISDIIIGINKFVYRFHKARILILAFYYSAQAFIVMGAMVASGK